MNQARKHKSKALAAWCLLNAVGFAGCVTNPYRFGRFQESAEPINSGPINVYQDNTPHPNLDRIEDSLHSSIRNVSEFFGADTLSEAELQCKRQEAAELALIYLQQHAINDIYVDQRVYSPTTQWARLRENPTMHPCWKYTGGTLSLVTSSLLPARVLRRDTYNPFTRTLSLNSAEPSLSLIAASESRIYAGSSMPGARATSHLIPFVPIHHRVVVAGEAVSYAHRVGDPQFLDVVYPRAYGYVGRKAATETIPFALGAAGVPFYFIPPISLGGNMAGRSIGGVMAKQSSSTVHR